MRYAYMAVEDPRLESVAVDDAMQLSPCLPAVHFLSLVFDAAPVCRKQDHHDVYGIASIPGTRRVVNMAAACLLAAALSMHSASALLLLQNWGIHTIIPKYVFKGKTDGSVWDLYEPVSFPMTSLGGFCKQTEFYRYGPEPTKTCKGLKCLPALLG